MLKLYIEYLKTFFKDEEGASAVEYALIVGLMAAVVISVIGIFEGGLTNLFTTVSAELTAAPTP